MYTISIAISLQYLHNAYIRYLHNSMSIIQYLHKISTCYLQHSIYTISPGWGPAGSRDRPPHVRQARPAVAVVLRRAGGGGGRHAAARRRAGHAHGNYENAGIK